MPKTKKVKKDGIVTNYTNPTPEQWARWYGYTSNRDRALSNEEEV